MTRKGPFKKNNISAQYTSLEVQPVPFWMGPLVVQANGRGLPIHV